MRPCRLNACIAWNAACNTIEAGQRTLQRKGEAKHGRRRQDRTSDERLGVEEAGEPDDRRQQARHRPVMQQVAALNDVIEPTSQRPYRRVRDL